MVRLESKKWVIDDIETVIFDKDGTFIDLHYFWGKITEMRAQKVINYFGLSQKAFSQVCLFLGYDTNINKMVPDGITALYSRDKIIEIFTKKLIEIGIETKEEFIIKIFDEVSEEFNKDINIYTKPIKEAIEFIELLYSKNVKLGVVTSDSIKSTLLTIKNNGWERFFEVVIGRESSSASKESGIPTKMALEKLNANPKKTIMIGDAPMDYISAQNAGIEKTVLVASGQLGAEELLNTSNYVVNSLKDIKCI